MALSADSPILIVGKPHWNLEEYPALADDVFYEGAYISVNSSGYAKPYAGTDSIFAGICYRQLDTTGDSNGDHNVKVYSDKFRALVTLASVAITNVDDDVYASDDGTLTLSSTNNLKVGKVVRYVTTNTAIVEFSAPQTTT